jgi:hypothetical protein
MTTIIPDKCTTKKFVVDRLVHLRVTTTACSSFLFKYIEIDFLGIKNRSNGTGSFNDYFRILQVKIIVFIIGDKSEFISPGS